MKTIKQLVFAWFIMSAIFQVVAIVFLVYKDSPIGVIISTGILIALFGIMYLLVRVLLDIQLIVNSQNLNKP